MTNLEIVLNMLAETATTEISDTREPKTFDENRMVAKEGGSIAGGARKRLEAKTGKSVISKDNFQKSVGRDNRLQLKKFLKKTKKI